MSSPVSPAAAITSRIAATAPSHQRRGSCSLHSGSRRLERVLGTGRDLNGAFGVEQYGLRGRGRDVEPEDVAHRSSSLGPDDPPLAVGRHAVRRDLAQRTERLELAEPVAQEHLDRRAPVRVDRTRLDLHVLLEHGAVPRVRGAAAAGRDPDLQPVARGDGVDDDRVGRQVQACVTGIRVRPEHERAVGLRSGGVRRRRHDHPPAQRELCDRPRRQRHGRAGAVRDRVIDGPPPFGSAHLDRLDQAHAVGRRLDANAAGHLGDGARAIVGLVRDAGDLGRRPQTMPAEQPVRRAVLALDRRVRKDRQHVVLVIAVEQPDDPRTDGRAHDRRVGTVPQANALVSREREGLERHRAPSSRSIVS